MPSESIGQAQGILADFHHFGFCFQRFQESSAGVRTFPGDEEKKELLRTLVRSSSPASKPVRFKFSKIQPGPTKQISCFYR